MVAAGALAFATDGGAVDLGRALAADLWLLPPPRLVATRIAPSKASTNPTATTGTNQGRGPSLARTDAAEAAEAAESGGRSVIPTIRPHAPQSRPAAALAAVSKAGGRNLNPPPVARV